MSHLASSLAEIDIRRDHYYTSCELSLLQQVYDEVDSELVDDIGPPMPADALWQTRTRVARAIMDLAEAGIRNPETLRRLALRTVGRRA
jgi:hypothetical protein